MPSHSRKTTLLATDHQRSVINALDENRPHPIAYTPYGHRPADIGLLSLLGFNGERPDPLTGHYHLGNGYRQFNPGLMRVNSPDSWSPFGEGGLNAYAYCGGDPRNRVDPTGHSFGILSLFRRTNTLARTSTKSPEAIATAKKIAFMEQGMRYKKQNLGYQLDEKAAKLKLDKIKIEEINTYTDIIKDSSSELINKIKELISNMPDSPQRTKAINGFNAPIQFPTVINPSSSRDHAVLALHSEAMYFNNHLGTLNHLQKKVTTIPASTQNQIRQLS